ncbi:MAG: DUF4956 domain-containing protein [Saprospiraceae bacterium]
MPEINSLQSLFSEESLTMILIVTMMTVLLSSFLVFTYDKTTPMLGRAQNFIQSLMLMSVVTATIMQSIGDSLALSFGIFGALAIIRFRSMISDPRDIAFIFATMAVGIACGVQSFQTAAIGTVAFCLIIFFLQLTPFSMSNHIKGNVRLDIGAEHANLQKAETLINELTVTNRLVRYRVSQNPDGTETTTYEFAFIVRNIRDGKSLQDKLHDIPGMKIQRLMFEDNFNLGSNN